MFYTGIAEWKSALCAMVIWLFWGAGDTSSPSKQGTGSRPQPARLGLANMRDGKGPQSCSALKMAGIHCLVMEKGWQDRLALKSVLFIGQVESTS